MVSSQVLADNYDLFKQNEAEKEAKLKMLPICKACEEPIQTEYCYGNNGKYICEHCLNEDYKHSVEDLI